MRTDRLLKHAHAVLVSVALVAIVGSCTDATAPSTLKTIASVSGAADTTRPTVVSTSPANGATNVPVATPVSATFSEAMDASTINGTTIKLRNTGTSAVIAGTVSYSAATNTATFTPSSALAPSTDYTVKIATAVKDLAGNTMASPFSSSFTTGALDTTRPTVSSNSPANGATNVAITVALTVTFSEAMNATTINSTNIKLRNTATSAVVSGTVTYNASTNTATFTPTASLTVSTSYSLKVMTGVKDVAGNALAAVFTSSFTTDAADATPPTVISTSPVNGAIGVPHGSVVTVTFSEPMNAATINGFSILLKEFSNTVTVNGTVTYNSGTNTATFTPTNQLDDGTDHTLTVTTGVTDVAGNPLAASYVSTFTTVQHIADQPYFEGSDAADRIHFHLSFSQSEDGKTLGLYADCRSLPLANCGMFPLTPEGADIIGPESPNMNGGAMIVGITGTFSDPNISFTVTLENGRTFTLTGTATNSWTMSLNVSGATLPATTLDLSR